MRYEWDPDKARRNRKKHGVSFADAVGVFEDDLALTVRDATSLSEERFSPRVHKAGTETVRGRLMRKEYDFENAKRGPVVKVPSGKTRITIRIDDDVVAWFRDQVEQAGGGNYQTLMNVALRQYIQGATEPLEATLRRVLREELKRAS